MNNRELFPNAKQIIDKSAEEAKAFGDNKIRPAHLVLAMLYDDNNQAVIAIKNLKLNNLVIYDEVAEFVTNSDFQPRVEVRRKPVFDEELKKLIKSVDNECEKLGADKIDTAHLLLSILSVKSSLTDLLKKNGITYDKLFNEVKKMSEPQNGLVNNDDSDTNSMPSGRFNSAPKSSPKSKTPVIDNFTRNIKKAVENNEIDPVIGREAEIKDLLQILSRRRKNNPIIIGEAGVGKTAIVEALAQRIHSGKVSPTIANKDVRMLDLTKIVAGTKYRGQFEERMSAIIDEAKANPEIILFIDEIHTLVGSGNATGSLDGVNIFKPALARGEIQIIGATTLDEYREVIEKDKALTRRFQQLLINEPSLQETKTILMNIKDKFESHHKVFYTEEAIDECIKLSNRYMADKFMPDKAIDVMDAAGAMMNVCIDKPKNIVELEELASDIENQKLDVVKHQRYEEAAKLRDEEKKVIAKIETAKNEWEKNLATNITEIGPEQIASVISRMCGVPISKLSESESTKLLNLDKVLTGKVIGQDDAVASVVKAIKRNRVGVKSKTKPIGSFIFLGKTGVGKTLLAKMLATEVFGDEKNLIRFDMSEYMEKFNVSKLIGAPPGYVGNEKGGELTEKIRRNPHSVVLFDEIEKAHPDIFNILLQLLEDGRLTDGLGRTVDFKNTVIILTSNVGVEELNLKGQSLGFEPATYTSQDKETSIIRGALEKKFKPEFLNRIDEAIIFKSLKPEDINKIVHVELAKLETRLAELKFKFKIAKPAVDYLALKGYDAKYGARPLNRAIQTYIEDAIADEILLGNLVENDIIHVTFDKKSEKILVGPYKKS